MSFNHHDPCSEVWAQGDLRRASCEAGRAACASEVSHCLDCNVVVASDPSTPTDTLAAAAQILAEEVQDMGTDAAANAVMMIAENGLNCSAECELLCEGRRVRREAEDPNTARAESQRPPSAPKASSSRTSSAVMQKTHSISVFPYTPSHRSLPSDLV